MEWTTLTRGWNWKSGDWTIDRRVTDRGTEFVIFQGNIPEEITGSLDAAMEFAEKEARTEETRTRQAALRATRQKIEALDAELRRTDLSLTTRASLISARVELTAP